MIVVGLLPPDFTGQGGAMWLCRCVCGDYEPRRSKAIKANLNPEHCCHECQYTLLLKKRASEAGQ